MGFQGYLLFLFLFAFSFCTTACTQASFDPQTPQAEDDTIPSIEKSTLTISSPIMADGITPAEVTLQIFNARGKPLAGKTMVFSVSGTNNVIVPCSPSSEAGWSRCRIYSTKAEIKKIIFAGHLDMKQDVVFEKVPAFKSSMAIVSAGSDQKLVSGHEIISSAGVSEAAIDMKDVSQHLRARSSILGSLIR